MNATEFIKEHGVEQACEVGRLVSSITVIQDLGGIDAAKAQHRRAKYSWFFGELMMARKLEKAIADYESIYGGEDE